LCTMSRTLFDVLVPDFLTQQDLIGQGMPEVEAGQQAARHNQRVSIAIRLLNGLRYLLLATSVIPAITALCLTRRNGTFVFDYVLQHINDVCDRPIGILLAWYWVSIMVTTLIMFMLGFLHFLLDACGECCGTCRFCPPAFKLLHWVVSVLAMVVSAFWLIWPLVTLGNVLRVRSCNPYLLEQTWVFLKVNLIALVCFIVHCVWPLLLPLLPKSTMTRDPEDEMQAYLAIDYNVDRFKDDVEHCFPCCCPICLEAFAPGHDIVGTPCSGQAHVFHRHCLAGWLVMNESCPLCRYPLVTARHRSRRSARDVELVHDGTATLRILPST